MMDAAFDPAVEGILARLPRELAADVDVQLMLMVRAGSEEAFEQLVGRNQQRVYSVIARLVGPGTEAEDLTQEVFLRVFRTAGSYRPTARFTTWLYRIAVNVSLNALRARNRARQRSLETLVSEGAGSGTFTLPDTKAELPGERMRRMEQAELVRQALEQLPYNQRLAIVLNKYESLRYEQIAQILGISSKAVKSLLARARSKLRQRLRRQLGAGR